MPEQKASGHYRFYLGINTIRYLGVELEDALRLSEQTDYLEVFIQAFLYRWKACAQNCVSELTLHYSQ